MEFNGLEKSELVIYNALRELPRQSFHITTLETLTGYSGATIRNALRNLQEKKHINYYKNSRFGPFYFEIKRECPRVILHA